MFNYLIFLIIALILIFVIYIGGKGLSRGIEAKSKLKEEKNRNIKKSNIVSVSKLSTFDVISKDYIIFSMNGINDISKESK